MLKKINKILAISLLAATTSYAGIVEETTPKNYVDLGVKGRLYEIQEQDILFQIKETAKNFKIDQNETRKQIEEQVAKAANRTTKLPLCDKDEFLEPEVDLYTIPTDIINPAGRMLARKGDKMKSKLPEGVELTLCFVYARNEISGDNQIKSFAKNNPKCLFLIANADVRGLREKYPDLTIFPTSEMQESRFGVKCFPSKVHFESDTKQLSYFSYDSFSKEKREIK